MVKIEKESDVVKQIKLTLALFCKEVVWVDRLQSGTIQSGPRFIHMCKPGTPDLYAIVKDKDGGHLVFIECKSPQGGYQSLEQKQFENRVKNLSHIHYILVRSVKEVIIYIKTNITERTLGEMLE